MPKNTHRNAIGAAFFTVGIVINALPHSKPPYSFFCQPNWQFHVGYFSAFACRPTFTVACFTQLQQCGCHEHSKSAHLGPVNRQ